MSYIAVPSDRILHLQDLELGVLIHYVIVSTSVHRFGVHSIVGWNSRPGKARQAAGTQPWSRSREVGLKRRQRSARAAMRKREAIEPRNS